MTDCDDRLPARDSAPEKEAVALELLTAQVEAVLAVVVGLAGLLLCTGAALHGFRGDRPLLGCALLLAGPLLVLAAQALGPGPVAAVLAVAASIALTARPAHRGRG